jgi:TolA-binding protein
MYDIILLLVLFFVLFLLIVFNAIRVKRNKKHHMVSTIKFHDNDVDLYNIISNITTENETLKDQVQDNLTKINKLDSRIDTHDDSLQIQFDKIDDNLTSTNDLKTNQINIQNDIRSHFLYTDVSEENSLNIQQIENEIDTLQSKMFDLQQNLSSIRYFE